MAENEGSWLPSSSCSALGPAVRLGRQESVSVPEAPATADSAHVRSTVTRATYPDRLRGSLASLWHPSGDPGFALLRRGFLGDVDDSRWSSLTAHLSAPRDATTDEESVPSGGKHPGKQNEIYFTPPSPK